jgi:hypothetical protein
MTGELRAPVPLRPGDPRHLGPYELLGRLGEGGMGTVYLARGPQGIPVAVKMVRADLAPDGDFRRRFRSEVNRVRQVPPFCTAEVLDADPDHEPPYLVVEYVNAPSLAEVVEERGPLSAANLHSVAIGVATALTAIHGAGVIHRDLKPRNVLLAPGSPKVIDFGIARALEATSVHTRTDQMVGTVAYMAPERFGSESGIILTPAADVFAWGAVVAYAGTGRTPFSADSPPATAARILTQPPNLSGLTGSLRELIGHSLEKEPGDRPTARELLDMLLATGPQRSAATAAALAHQPKLRAAAQEAQAATAYGPGRQLTAAAVPPELAGFAEHTTDRGDALRSGTPTGTADAPPDVDGGSSTRTVYPDHLTAHIRTALPDMSPGTQMLAPRARFRIPMQSLPAPLSPAAPPATPPAAPERRRPWVFPLALVLLIVAMAGGAFMIKALGPPSGEGDDGVGVDDPGRSADSSAAVPAALVDRLQGPWLWKATADPKERADCFFAPSGDGLIARRKSPGSFRCPGPQDAVTVDQSVDVGVRLLSKGTCASIWLRYRSYLGYQVRVCTDRVLVGWHKDDVTDILRTIPLSDRIEVGEPSTRISLVARGSTVQVSRDGTVLAVVPLTDPDIIGGKAVLGIFTEEGGGGYKPPYEVAFDNVTVQSLGG